MRTTKNSTHIGKYAEALAEAYLTSQGLRILSRNYQCRTGEIDRIATDKQVIIFIEVRYRSNNRFGHPAATIDWHKQRKIIQTAAHYLQRQPISYPCRFDVVTITGNLDPKVPLPRALKASTQHKDIATTLQTPSSSGGSRTTDIIWILDAFRL